MQEQEYRSWIREQVRPHNEVILQENDHELDLQTKWAEGQVVFYPQNVVELIVTQEDENKFYLHFELDDDDHAKELFQEMFTTLLQVQKKREYRVLLTCSSGMTTSFFANKLNEVANLLQEPYTFDAKSYTLLYQIAYDYDIILLAPQITHRLKEISASLPDKLVIRMPIRIFASYNASDCLTFVKSEFEKLKAQTKENRKDTLEHNPYRILTLGLINHKDDYRFAYRIYDHGKPTLDKEVIKTVFAQRDMYDLLDYIYIRHTNIDAICLSIPGVVSDGFLYQPEYGFDHEDLRKKIEEKYHTPVYLINDVNAVALGYHGYNPEIDNLIFYFQPIGFIASGAGIIQDGKLVTGRKNAAGEMKYDLYAKFGKEDEMDVNSRMLEIVTSGLLSIISVLAPEKICIHSLATPNVDQIRTSLQQYIPDEYIPDLVMVHHMKKYMLSGSLLYCLEQMERDKK